MTTLLFSIIAFYVGMAYARGKANPFGQFHLLIRDQLEKLIAIVKTWTNKSDQPSKHTAPSQPDTDNN